METQKPEPPKPPSNAALAAAYQVTARSFANQAQILWRAVSLFVTFNALVVALLQFVPTLPDFIRIVLPFGGFVYCVCWHFAMRRLWIYHDAYIRTMREQEDALHLGSLGPFSRAYQICDGGRGETIGGDHTRFSATLRLRFLFAAIIWLFGVAYLLFLVEALRHIAFK